MSNSNTGNTEAEGETTDSSTRRFTLAVCVLFFANGAVYGNWLPRLPEIKDRLEVSNSGLAVALLGGGIGGIVGSLVVGRIMLRVGSKRLVLNTLLVLPLFMALIAFVGRAWMLLVVLALIGLIDVMADVAMNAQGVIAQERLQRSIMNRLHGLWSLGFASGTLVGSLCAGLDVDLRVQVVSVAIVLIALSRVVGRHLAATDPQHDASGDAAPSRRQLGILAVSIAISGACAISLEGAPNEWAAWLMRDEFGLGSWAGFGTVAFGSGMLLGRFSGDHVQERLGFDRMFRFATILIVVGLAAAIITNVVVVGLLGLFVAGVGQSFIFPRLYMVSARIHWLSAGAGLGALMVGLRVGGMATTLSMVAISDATNLRVALAVVGIVALIALLVSNAAVAKRVV
ncbi:MAG: MFS transporter [Actinomycetota bacterium]